VARKPLPEWDAMVMVEANAGFNFLDLLPAVNVSIKLTPLVADFLARLGDLRVDPSGLKLFGDVDVKRLASIASAHMLAIVSTATILVEVVPCPG